VTTIRRATVDDGPGLAAMRWAWHLEGKAAPLESYDEFVANYCRWWAGIDTHRAVVAEADGDLVGAGVLALLQRVPDVDHLVRVDGDIQSVYVAPEHRGTGIGALIVRELMSIAAGLGCEKVTVSSSTRALPLYVREGFGPGAKLLMWKPSNDPVSGL
jgi:GNAT superfamily N-acetyltransferase